MASLQLPLLNIGVRQNMPKSKTIYTESRL